MIAQKIPLAPGLWLVGAPIGTARDITLRALDVLFSADVLAAEDTRSLRKLMDIHGVPLEDRRVHSLHDHSGEGHVERLLSCISNGQSVAYASEAGMPLIADPGFELVRAAQEAGHLVSSAPGPSAVTTALALGGLGTDSFHFAGFLPSTRTARRKALENLRNIDATLVFYESPKRLPWALEDAVEVLGDRPARICRELTKKFEEVRTGTLSELCASCDENPARGEIVLLVNRPPDETVSADSLTDALKAALAVMSVKDAAKYVAEATGAPKRDVYQLALKLKIS